MIPDEEAEGLLLEADYAERTGHNGGMVLLTPPYLRSIIKKLRVPNEEIEQAVASYAADYRDGHYDSIDNLIRGVIFWVIEDRWNKAG